jgi:hypothetical protein
VEPRGCLFRLTNIESAACSALFSFSFVGFLLVIDLDSKGRHYILFLLLAFPLFLFVLLFRFILALFVCYTSVAEIDIFFAFNVAKLRRTRVERA